MFGNHKLYLLLLYLASVRGVDVQWEQAKDNGDIYAHPEDFIDAEEKDNDEGMELSESEITMRICNASFSVPMENLEEFNRTAELPDAYDRTGPCFLRCLYERLGLINNFKLNTEKVREHLWPATGDSIPYCQEQGKNEKNACKRTYAIVKCLQIRALVDARNDPVV